ncbi:hypothetical protein UVI_02017620 [Ustilaginoidea virens]|uniref:Uncharacterized protein n=1 Tax=Ustilaginoidea virens TaxID=1159556 RepID=A0A1B5KUP2_USTVR|nr:hypothetical protein UVI_02017620 [Ustilaginoidea virens]
MECLDSQVVVVLFNSPSLETRGELVWIDAGGSRSGSRFARTLQTPENSLQPSMAAMASPPMTAGRLVGRWRSKLEDCHPDEADRFHGWTSTMALATPEPRLYRLYPTSANKRDNQVDLAYLGR